VAMAGPAHPAHERALAMLTRPPANAPLGLAGFLRDALRRIDQEMAAVDAGDREVAERLRVAAGATGAEAAGAARGNVVETLWSALFPEGVGILGREEERVAALRSARTVQVDELAARPIADVPRQVLFTSNVLLTVPSPTTDLDAVPWPGEVRRRVREASLEPQAHWYDHPIQVGVRPEANELLHGLRGLDEAVRFERARGRAAGPIRVALSLSVTHPGLRDVGRDIVRHELARIGRLEHLAIHVFTDGDSDRLVREVLAPAAGGDVSAAALAEVFGVDGEYGRHYSFLKALAATWQVLVDPGIEATFKIDLDQVFPQAVLVAETGSSAFEHLASPLWGARGRDAEGRPVELGMLAGALVNEADIGRGLFTPDVTFPDGPATADEHIFFSRLPQALSTRAEMMERYAGPERDGRRTCLERIHVTGGTNGIRVDALRRHQPFTPTFVGRAEDQAYLLSVLDGPASGATPRLAYAHQAGLIMRHDKEAFAGEAIAAARGGKIVGDHARVLLFSAYAGLIGRERVKRLIDPFTGCFVSRLPVSVTLLRYALRIGQAWVDQDAGLCRDLGEIGPVRIGAALALSGDPEALRERVDRERRAWSAYYVALDRLERGIAAGDGDALRLRDRARDIVAATRVS
jgi:hypothetical protein